MDVFQIILLALNIVALVMFAYVAYSIHREVKRSKDLLERLGIHEGNRP